MSENAAKDDPLIVWGGDYTPSIDCDRCSAELLAYPNGNAPLQFTLSELVQVVEAHQCKSSVDDSEAP